MEKKTRNNIDTYSDFTALSYVKVEKVLFQNIF